MRKREERITVRMSARLNVDGRWSDVAIRNISAHGLLLHAASPPRTGTFIEIRRATQIIVARIVWVCDDTFGVRTQDALDVRAIITDKPTAPRALDDGRTDRRRDTRRAPTAERSRQIATMLQFAFAALVVAGIAALLAGEVYGLLNRPFATLTSAMASTAR